ncbi:IS701 family transposase [Streptomyces sp. NPDC001093]|uniref:IS701 family transposase n=1 Tax=Streptomyces sp. NPDC001093 TaxID=3154376 RepID=UPI003329A10C
MSTYQETVAVEATIAGQAWAKAFGAAMGVIGGCFARREARETARELTAGLLLEVHTRNCWTLAEALGHPGPHRLQHLLSRARFDHDQAREQVARMVIDHLADEDVVLVVDETGDAKSSTGCVGAGRQYSGALHGVGLCQVAVHLAVVTSTTRVIIDRALYLPADWVADDERREAAGVPDEITFATKSQQAARMVADALDAGVRARWFAADEVYCGRELRMEIRRLGLGYAVGVPATHPVVDGAGRRWQARQLLNKVRPEQWMRQATGDGAKGRRQLAKGYTGLDQGQVTCWNSWTRWSLFSLIAAAVLTMTLHTETPVTTRRPTRLVPLTCPELVRFLRTFVLPPPTRDREHALRWTAWR